MTSSSSWPVLFLCRTGGLPIGLRHSGSWLEDLVLALKMPPCAEPDSTGVPLVAGDTWREGRDFVWTPAEAVRASAAHVQPAVTTRAPSDPLRLLRATEVVPVPWWKIVRPSAHESATAMPDTVIRAPASIPAWLRSHPLASPTLEGSLVHRALREWCYSGPVEGRHLDAAIRAEVGETRDPALRVWLQAIFDHALAAQPGMMEELARAAARGDVHHEAWVSVTFEAEGERVTRIGTFKAVLLYLCGYGSVWGRRSRARSARGCLGDAVYGPVVPESG